MSGLPWPGVAWGMVAAPARPSSATSCGFWAASATGAPSAAPSPCRSATPSGPKWSTIISADPVDPAALLRDAGTGDEREIARNRPLTRPRPDLPRPNGVWDMGAAEAAEMAKLAETTYRDVNIGLIEASGFDDEDHGIHVVERWSCRRKTIAP